MVSSRTGKPRRTRSAEHGPQRTASAEPARRSAAVDTVSAALDDMKALDVAVLDVRGLTDITDTMIIASGTSDRHVRSIADRVVERVKAAGIRPLGIEGGREGEWVLVDLNDVILHVMLPRIRELYGLEHLWEGPDPHAPAPRAAAPRDGRRRRSTE
jgi:ribosome-associated protein